MEQRFPNETRKGRSIVLVKVRKCSAVQLVVHEEKHLLM